MAFDGSRLSNIVDSIGGGSVRLFGYETSDDLDVVLGPGYVTNAEQRGVRIGDLVIVSDGEGAAFIASVDSISVANDTATLQLAADNGGISPTGGADDTSLLQSRIDALDEGGGGCLRLGPGTFKVQGLNFYPGIYIEGSGAGVTILTVPANYTDSAAVGTAILNAMPHDDETIFQYGGVKYLSIIGPGTGVDQVPGNGNSNSVNGIDFRRINYPNPSSYRLYQWTVEHCRIGQCNVGLYFYKNLYDVTVQNNFVYSNDIGMYVDQQHPNFLNNDFRFNDIGVYGRGLIDWACTQNRISLGRIGVTGDFSNNYNTTLNSYSMDLTNLGGAALAVGYVVVGSSSGAVGTITHLSLDGEQMRVTKTSGSFSSSEAFTVTGHSSTGTLALNADASGGVSRSVFSACTMYQNAELGLDCGSTIRVHGCLFKGPRGDFPTPVSGNNCIKVRGRQYLITGNTFFGDNDGAHINLAQTNAATQSGGVIANNHFFINDGPAIEKTGNGSVPHVQILGNHFNILSNDAYQLGTGNALATGKGLILHVPSATALWSAMQFCGNNVRVDGTAIIVQGDPDVTYDAGLTLATALISISDTGTGHIVKDNILRLTGTVTAASGFTFNNVTDGNVSGNSFQLSSTGTNAFTAKMVLGTTTRAIVKDNQGFVTEAYGTATVANATTEISVAHGLAATPARVAAWPTNNLGTAAKFWVPAADIGATNFKIKVDVDPGAGTATFGWLASVLTG